jgi:hypothetical protein
VNLETISAIAQLVAALGVIASLFYLAAQIRQNTRSMRAVVVDSLAHSLIDLLGPQAHDLEFTRAFSRVIKDWNGASEEDRARTVSVLLAVFKLFENAWFQKRQGTLDPQQWEGWDAYARMYFHLPGVQTWWQLRRAAFAHGFRNYREASQPIAEMTPLSEIIRGRPGSSDGGSFPRSRRSGTSAWLKAFEVRRT